MQACHRVVASQPDIERVQDEETLRQVRALRRRAYRRVYPAIDVDEDAYDAAALVLFARSVDGRIGSTARLVIDGPLGLPEDAWFPPRVAAWRREGVRLMELGRFVVEDGGPSLLKAYYRAFYTAAKQHRVDIVLMAMKPKDVSLHQRLMGARLLESDMGVSYGGATSLACMAWELQSTTAHFFQWSGARQ